MIARLRILGAVFAFSSLAAALAPPSAAQDRVPAELTVPRGFEIESIARVPKARELAIAPNGDLFVGTSGGSVEIVSDAEGSPSAPRTFATIADAPDSGVALGDGKLYVGGRSGVWFVGYDAAKHAAAGEPVRIARVRPGNQGGHSTTTVAVSRNKLYISVGSSCNACAETDPTRATIQEANLDGSGMHPKAVHIRNAIALAVNSATGAVWAGVAGQDELEASHPYEIFDPFTLHDGIVDYGWPVCYENRKPVHGNDCSGVTPPRAVFPAYDTPIGAAIYPRGLRGKYAFPQEYAGGAFVGLHGSWHRPLVPPRVAFVPLRGDDPIAAVDWSDPAKQWREFVGGWQRADQSRTGRPTGVAVGPKGSLFVADDLNGAVYRVRPTH
ncbi:MAG: hypothetical protein GIW95_01660 [Candidatus Eremiobacteraeota bacterium]|nr:hypothetical protein [Candidatus Eremiobacteraeota bacterium]